MGLVIFLRRRAAINKFREILINSLNSGIGDEALICSGFFQELWGTQTYQASQEGNFQKALVKHNITLNTIGVHNGYWIAAYRNFRDNLIASGVNINSKIKKGLHWHAKVYILKRQNKPILAIVGSSNITRNAFSTTSPFNYETDVVLWLDEFEDLNRIVSLAVEELAENTNEVIVADYDPNKNFGLSLEEKLNQLMNDFENLDLNDLA